MNDALSTPTAHRTASAESPANRLGRLFDQCHARLSRLALRLGDDRETARDLVQETFLRAAGQPAKLPAGDDRAEAWLVRVMVNLGRDRWRKLEVRRRDADRLVDTAGAMPASAVDPETQTVAKRTVRQALSALPPKRRAVIALCELEGLSSTETARMLGIRRVTVRWHLAAARKQLAASLLGPPNDGSEEEP